MNTGITLKEYAMFVIYSVLNALGRTSVNALV